MEILRADIEAVSYAVSQLSFASRHTLSSPSLEGGPDLRALDEDVSVLLASLGALGWQRKQRTPQLEAHEVLLA